MKTFEKIIGYCFVLVLLFSAEITFGQQAAQTNTPESTAAQRTKYEAKALQLEAEEAIDLAQINLLYAQQMSELRKKASDANNKDDVEALKRSHTNKIRSILSSAKYQEYLALDKKDKKDEKKEDSR